MTRKIVEVVEDPKRRLLGTCKHSGPACWPCVADDMEAQRDAAEERERALREALKEAAAYLAEQEWSAWRSSDGSREYRIGADCCPECAGVKADGHESVCRLVTTLRAARAALALGTGKGGEG